jgi:L-ribulose-5-phosphate 4-epimerase
MYEELRQKVCQANLDLERHGLVVFTWGNVSGIDRSTGVVAIKPSGVAYSELTPDKMVLLDLDGNVLEGSLHPSSDTPTHLELYRGFEQIGGICHTHSLYATMWAQAERQIPCLGTTHADHFYGPVPVTEVMTGDEIEQDYERNTGKVIVRRFENLDPLQMPAVLVANHGPFTWGKTPAESVENAVVLERVAQMAFGTFFASARQGAISQALLDKHYLRKHGQDAYYGQKGNHI